MRWLRLAAVLLVAVVLALHLIPLEQLRRPIGRALTARVGRPVEIAGPIRVSLLGGLHFDVSDVTVSELPGVAHLGRVELELALAPLRHGHFDVTEVILTDGRVEIDGRVAVDEGVDAAAEADRAEAAPEATAAISFHVARIEIRDHLIVHTNRAGLVTTLDLERLEVEAPEREGPVRAEAGGSLDGLDFDLEGVLGAPAQLDAAGAAYPVELRGSFEQMDFSATGSVDHPRTLAGLALDVSLAAPDLSSVAFLGDRALPAIGPVTARGRISNRDGTVGVEGAVIKVGGTQDALHLTATGELDDFDRLDEIAFRVELGARDLEVIGELLGVKLPSVGKVSLTGDFRGSHASLVSEHFSLRLDETQVAGHFSGSVVPGRRPKLSGTLESPVVHLDDIGLEPSKGHPGFLDAGGTGIASDEPLPLASLPAIDARIAVRADQVQGRGDLMIDELRFDFVLDRTGVAIENLQVLFADGAVKANARVRADAEPPAATLELDAAGVRVHRLLAQFEPEPFMSGSLDVSVGFVSRGRTLRGLERNLDGRATLLVTNGRTRSAYAHALEFDLRRAAFGSRAREKFEKLECVIGDFRIDRGVARVQTLWLETDAVFIEGSGAIDLGGETFALTFVPTPKQRKLLGTAPTVSLSGSFSAPVVTAQKSSLATSAVKGLLSGITRPLTGILRPVRPIVDPVTDPVLKPVSPILDTFFERQGGESGPCGEYVTVRAKPATDAESPPAR